MTAKFFQKQTLGHLRLFSCPVCPYVRNAYYFLYSVVRKIEKAMLNHCKITVSNKQPIQIKSDDWIKSNFVSLAQKISENTKKR